MVHCAALAHQMKGAPEEEYFKVNCDLTVELANAAKSKGVKHFIFISTAHVFGDSGTLNHVQKLRPDSPCFPKDGYGKSKLAAENALFEIQNEDFRVSVIRPPMVYGEGAKGNLVKLAQLIQKVPVLPFGYAKNRRSLIYVGNLTHFIHKVIENSSGGIFLPQDELPLSISEISRLIAKVMNKGFLSLPVPHFLIVIAGVFLPKFATRLYGSLVLDPGTSRCQIAYTPIYSTEEGFRRMLTRT